MANTISEICSFAEYGLDSMQEL